MLSRLGEVLSRAKFAGYTDPESVAAYLWVLRRFAVVVADPVVASPLTGDPEDDRVVAVAHASGVDALVSGDPHILNAELRIPVMSPAAYLDSLGPDPSEPAL